MKPLIILVLICSSYITSFAKSDFNAIEVTVQSIEIDQSKIKLKVIGNGQLLLENQGVSSFTPVSLPSTTIDIRKNLQPHVSLLWEEQNKMLTQVKKGSRITLQCIDSVVKIQKGLVVEVLCARAFVGIVKE